MTSPDPNSRPTVAEQVADILLKLMTPGGVTIGGVSAFWFLFGQSDIPKAVASAAIGLSISYAARLLQPLHRANQRLLDDLERKIGEEAERITDRIFTRLTAFEGQYLRMQSIDCQDYRTEGLSQHTTNFIPLLQDVSVSLELSFNQTVTESESVRSSVNNSLTIWDLLRETEQPTFRQIAILANAGYGKTTLLKHVTYTYSTCRNRQYKVSSRVPVLLFLRKYSDILTQSEPPSLPELITRFHIPSLPESRDLKVPRNWSNDILMGGKAIIMLDGFDEVPKTDQQTVSNWINWQIRNYPRSTFIITSRPFAYIQEYREPKPATTIFIKSFSALQQESFIKQWYFSQEFYSRGGQNNLIARQQAEIYANNLISQINERPELQEMAKSPLLLVMIANVHRHFGEYLPQRRATLYQEIFRLQLGSRPSSKGIYTPVSIQESLGFLQQLALTMLMENRISISKEKLLERLQLFLNDFDIGIQPREFLNFVEQVGGVVTQRELDEYEFVHISFQMYLAAKEIYDHQQESLLIKHSKDEFWQEVIYLYVELLSDPRSFIRKLVAPISNPYIVGSPVTGNLFVGREDILRRFEELWNNVEQLPSIVLYGHRRMGKTSILRNLAQHIEKDIIVDFNMQRVGYVSSTGELLYNLALAIYYAIAEDRRKNFEEPLELEFLEKNPMTSFDSFLKRIDPVRDDKRFIIAVDEFEIIESLIEAGRINPQLLGFWRSLIQTYPWFIMVLSGLHTLQEMTHDYWNPLFGSIQTIPVSFLSPKATELLIVKPSPDFDLEYTAEAVKLIHKLTYGQPYLVQLICHNLVTYFNRERFEKGIYREPPLTARDVELITHMPEFYRDGDAYFNGIWEQAKEVHRQEQVEILQALSHQPLTSSELSQQTGIGLEQMHKALKTLEQHDVIYKEENHYKYRVELMRRWVLRQPANNRAAPERT